MRERRGTIALEQAQVLEHTALPANQYVLRLHAPKTAKRAVPGQFVHLQCEDDLQLRRPLSIMRTAEAGWIEVLYKPVGAGLAALTRRAVGQSVSVLGPIGNGFDWSTQPRNILALGGGVGIPPMIFAAQVLAGETGSNLIVYVGSEIPFPFELVPAEIDVPGIDAADKSTLALLHDLGLPCALASGAGLPGSHVGFVTELAEKTLATFDSDERANTLLLACGPEPMLAAAARLADKYAVACQLALEEYMACGVGGCAGCTVEVHTADGPAMQRVCVDGPVFDSTAIYPPL